MAVTKDYYAYLVSAAKETAALKKKALDAAMLAATTAQFDKSGKFTGYAKTATGAPKMGTLDVAHEQNKKGIQAGGEAAGMLQSGQQAERLSSEEADWRSRIAAQNLQTGQQKSQIGTDLAQQLAEYQAVYGKPKSSGGSNGNAGSQQLNQATSRTPYETGAIGAISMPPVAPWSRDSYLTPKKTTPGQNNRPTSRTGGW